jgi:hypothetical protein
VEVGNDAIGIVPNSLSYKKGKGDKNVRSQSAGGDSIAIVITENAETKKGMVKFSLYNTAENQALLDSWQDSDETTIRLSQGSFTLSFRSMVVTSDPEVSTGADGSLEVVFEGQPAV